MLRADDTAAARRLDPIIPACVLACIPARLDRRAKWDAATAAPRVKPEGLRYQRVFAYLSWTCAF